jgi:hypothetical protein
MSATTNKVRVFSVMVRRDAQTITPVTVPEYEIAVLQTIFGEESILNADSKLIKEAGLGEPVGELPLGEDEHVRLARKYGAGEDGKTFVEKVFGTKAGKGLDRAVAECVVKEAAEGEEDEAPAAPKKTGKKKPELDQSDDAAQ